MHSFYFNTGSHNLQLIFPFYFHCFNKKNYKYFILFGIFVLVFIQQSAACFNFFLFLLHNLQINSRFMRMLLLWLDTMTMTVMVMIMIVVGSMIMMIYNKWLHSWVTNSPVCYCFMCWLVDVVLILHKKNNIYIFYVNCLVWHLFIFSLFHFFYFFLVNTRRMIKFCYLQCVLVSLFFLCRFRAKKEEIAKRLYRLKMIYRS